MHYALSIPHHTHLIGLRKTGDVGIITNAGGRAQKARQPGDHCMSQATDFDSLGAVHKSRANKLAALLATGEERARLWRPDELAAIFRHQISTPMLVDLGGFDPRSAARLKLVSETQGLLLKSFADLLQHPTPPVELLEVVKNFAKANLDQPESGLPAEIASALYYLCIAAALGRRDARISQLPNADLRRGLSYTREQTWLDEPARALLALALEKIAGGSGTKP